MITTAVAEYPAVSNPTISVRRADGTEHECGVRNASDQLLRSALPWRTFRWYFGQRHYSGNYWAATMRQSLIYESRLEQANLLLADFDPDITHMVSQPFLMRAVVDGRLRRHIPESPRGGPEVPSPPRWRSCQGCRQVGGRVPSRSW
jgi:hypothetical protein